MIETVDKVFTVVGSVAAYALLALGGLWFTMFGVRALVVVIKTMRRDGASLQRITRALFHGTNRNAQAARAGFIIGLVLLALGLFLLYGLWVMLTDLNMEGRGHALP